ncbi:MAG: hypothetical protein EXX96DRAFT_576203 [Benjaminiella poitrasii]|nr:MAG: hypothetical protein EXX96DRAFT_576203 [Benjaminiella poitrasii]
MEFDRCLSSYSRHDSIDYSRRPSYFTGLLAAPTTTTQSEAGYSEHEQQQQQTPSPFTSYEDYQYRHPLDNSASNKRRMSTLVELPQLGHAFEPHSYQHYHHPHHHSIDLGYPTVVNPWLTATVSPNSSTTTHSSSASTSPSRMSSSPMMYTATIPSIDMYSSPNYLNSSNSNAFDHHSSFHSLCPPMIDSHGLSTTGMNDGGMFRERASSSSSSSTDSSSLSISPPSSRRTSTKAKPTTAVKTTRSRGRRVSSNPNVVGQKVFTCRHDDCGKVFKRSEHLKRHIRSIHTLEKPFECPYQSCSKRFSRSDNLNQHIRIHRHTGKDKSNNNNAAAASNNRSSSFSNYMPTY